MNKILKWLDYFVVKAVALMMRVYGRMTFGLLPVLYSTNALSSQGMTLAVASGIGSPQVFSTIPELTTIGGPSGSANLLDATDLSSTAKAYNVGLHDEGEIKADIMYIPDNTVHSYLHTSFTGTTLNLFRLTFTDTAPAKIWEFQGYVTGFSVTAGVDQILKAAVTIKITGAITEYN